MSNVKICKDCKHYLVMEQFMPSINESGKEKITIYRCLASKKVTTDLINGSEIVTYKSCEEMRNYTEIGDVSNPTKEGECGYSGKLWEKKDG